MKESPCSTRMFTLWLTVIFLPSHCSYSHIWSLLRQRNFFSSAAFKKSMIIRMRLSFLWFKLQQTNENVQNQNKGLVISRMCDDLRAGEPKGRIKRSAYPAWPVALQDMLRSDPCGAPVFEPLSLSLGVRGHLSSWARVGVRAKVGARKPPARTACERTATVYISIRNARRALVNDVLAQISLQSN